MYEFVEEAIVLSRWLGRDVSVELGGAVPRWTVFRFRDAAVFQPDVSEGPDPMYLVCGEAVCAFGRGTIDDAYAELRNGHPLTAAA